jgi:hypothetical protein
MPEGKGQEARDWQHRAHFFAVSAQIMRHILLELDPAAFSMTDFQDRA